MNSDSIIGKNTISFFDDLQKSINDSDKIFVYGAGEYGVLMLGFLESQGIGVDGVVVSSLDENNSNVKGYHVHCVDEILSFRPTDDKYLFILSMREKWQKEIIESLEVESQVNLRKIPSVFFREIRAYMFHKACVDTDEMSYRKWRVHLYNVTKRNAILVRREGGIGDLLTLEPILRKLKLSGYTIILETVHTYLFKYNNSVNYVFKWGTVPEFIISNCLLLDLNVSHEFYPHKHMLDGYYLCVKELIEIPPIEGEDRLPCYNPSIRCRPTCPPRKICLNNEATEWKSRILNPVIMKGFAEYLKKIGCEIFEIGSNKKNYLGVGIDCFGMEFEDTVSLMSEMDMYVGLDNGLMHVAQSILLPVFLTFGCTCPNLRIHDWSRARVMWKNTNELSCAACFHRRRIPCKQVVCIYEECFCLAWTEQDLINAFEKMEYDSPPCISRNSFFPLWCEGVK